MLRLAEPLQRLAQDDDIFCHIIAFAGIGLADRLQHLRKSGPSPALIGREIGPAPKRLAIRGQEHRQWPATLLTHQRQRVLIDLVEVGPLLAVDFDIDEQPVHRRRDLRIFEALPRHDMAPMAGRVADRQQDRLAGRFGRFQRSLRSQGCQ